MSSSHERIVADVRDYLDEPMLPALRVKTIADPVIPGVYAVRVQPARRDDDPCDFVWTDDRAASDSFDRLEEVTFTHWPPRGGVQ